MGADEPKAELLQRAQSHRSGRGELLKQINEVLCRRALNCPKSQSSLAVEQEDLRRVRSRRNWRAAQKLGQRIDVLHSRRRRRPGRMAAKTIEPAVQHLRTVTEGVDRQAQQLHARLLSLPRHFSEDGALDWTDRRTTREHELHGGDLAAQTGRQTGRPAIGIDQRQIGCRPPRKHQAWRWRESSVRPRARQQARGERQAEHLPACRAAVQRREWRCNAVRAWWPH